MRFSVKLRLPSQQIYPAKRISPARTAVMSPEIKLEDETGALNLEARKGSFEALRA